MASEDRNPGSIEFAKEVRERWSLEHKTEAIGLTNRRTIPTEVARRYASSAMAISAIVENRGQLE